MKKFILLPLALAIASSNTLASNFNYEASTAVLKQQLLRHRIEKSAYSKKEKLPINESKYIDLISPLFLSKAFTNSGDELAYGRPKAIHANGVAGLIEWIPNLEQKAFTGILATGALGVVRFSTTMPDFDEEFKPGMALKLLIDHKPSTNFVAMYTLEGQGANQNFFEHSLTTWIPEPTDFFIKVGVLGFQYALNLFKDSPSSSLVIPLDDISSIKRNGELVPESQISTPEALVFIPNPSLKKSFTVVKDVDFRMTLMQIPSESVLYDIYTSEQGGKNPGVYLGKLVLKSRLVASEYGDQKLYFKHPRVLTREQLIQEN